jgi:hypothetical protein
MKKQKVKRINPYKLLMAKIDRIRQRVPTVEPTGACKDPDTGEILFRFTEAQNVYELYRAECEVEGLCYRPYIDEHIQPKVIAVGNMPMLIGTFCIEDLTTGAKVIGWGCGMGRNLDWSGNTAGTRALKQFLLTIFEATWQDPDNPILTKERIREQVLQELEDNGTLAQIEQIKFWAEKFRKGAQNANTEGQNTEHSPAQHRAGNRERKKRHSNRSQCPAS